MLIFSYAAPRNTFDTDGSECKILSIASSGSDYEQSCQRLDPVIAHTRFIGLIL